jgi:hypothetical protein
MTTFNLSNIQPIRQMIERGTLICYCRRGPDDSGGGWEGGAGTRRRGGHGGGAGVRCGPGGGGDGEASRSARPGGSEMKNSSTRVRV